MKFVAQRELQYSLKGDKARSKVIVSIGEPYLLRKEQVNFNFDEGAAGCSILIEGNGINIKEFEALPED